MHHSYNYSFTKPEEGIIFLHLQRASLVSRQQSPRLFNQCWWHGAELGTGACLLMRSTGCPRTRNNSKPSHGTVKDLTEITPLDGVYNITVNVTLLWGDNSIVCSRSLGGQRKGINSERTQGLYQFKKWSERTLIFHAAMLCSLF